MGGLLGDAIKNPVIKGCHSKWKGKISYILRHTVGPKVPIWNPSKLENSLKLYELFINHNLVKLRNITNNINLVINQLPYFKSVIGDPLNDEGKFWQKEIEELDLIQDLFNNMDID